MVLRFIDYKTAVRSKNRYARWPEALDRLRPEAWPQIRPTFSLNRGDTVLTIGSCFARSIEGHLARIGFKVPTLSFRFEQTSVLNKYTPPSISQEIQWAARIYRRDDVMTEHDCRDYAYVLQNGSVIDNNLADFAPVPYEQFINRRRMIYGVFRHAFFANCIVLTPGLAEAWFDSERGLFIQQILTGHHSAISRNLRFTMLDFETCFNCLDQVVAEVRSLNANAKFLVTTSPIPLERTFTGDDVIIANTHAKSVLRAACGEVAAKWEGVDYFPSFESASLTRDWSIIASDGLHLEGSFVNKIVNRTVEFYVGGIGEAERLFEAALAEPESGTALGYLERAISIAPHIWAYRFAMASVYLKAGDDEGAIRANDEAIDLYLASGDVSKPGLARPEAKLLFRWRIYQKQGDLEKERDTLIEILKYAPDSAHMQFRLGGILWALNDVQGAEAPFMRAWELQTYDPLEVGISLGNTWCHLGKPAQAITLALGMTAEWSGQTELWTLLGNAYLRMNDSANAEGAFARAVEVDPTNEAARYNLDKLREVRQGAPAQ